MFLRPDLLISGYPPAAVAAFASAEYPPAPGATGVEHAEMLAATTGAL